MKIAQINTCSYGSTGRIAIQLCELVERDGGVSYLCVPNGRHNRNPYKGNHVWIGGRVSEDTHLILSRLTGMNGCFSRIATRRFLRRLDGIRPDVIHLHNLHNSYINLPMLFRYIKKRDIPVVWTLHDCWAFTGQCPYFTVAACDKWKDGAGCHSCPQYRSYPQSYVDRTRTMYKLKKKWFTGVKRMTIATPSQWLADCVSQSYRKDYETQVVSNGIDLSVFKPTESDFRKKHGIGDQKIILGVALGWGHRKGFDVFLELAKRLDPKEYRIVMVGTDDRIDAQLPSHVISIHRTANQKELAAVYTAADVFVNPTRDEVFGLVNTEALACGTPVITFNSGGSPECIDETCGSVVACDDVEGMYNEILRICRDTPYSKEACMARAAAFDKNDKFRQYLELYRRML